jgi:VWFA-related protein
MVSDPQGSGLSRRWLYAFGAAAALSCPGLALSQQQDAQPGFRTEANYVRVEVYATRNGVPVTDLRRDDFELFEAKAPQRIEQFDRVVTGTGGIQDAQAEPNTVRESAQAAAAPQAGVFVLFLDAAHVDRRASEAIAAPLQRTLARLIGPADLLAVMTPAMSARDITFSRRSGSAVAALDRPWGTRDQVTFDDPVEQSYARCYPGVPSRPGTLAADRGIAQEMILRRREKQTLDALEDLVLHLRDVREERKAIITITNGWRLYGRSATLSRAIGGESPTVPPIAIDPRNGRIATADQPQNGKPTPSCERDRLALAELDDGPRFRRILDLANRANASFYPVDPRGMAVFDEDIMPAAGVGAGPGANPLPNALQDQQRLAERRTSLRTMAELTDGVAVVDTSDLALGLRRIAADLSSYYLLGYYSDRSMDGRFHPIEVRVKRPGIQIRARRGYLALPNAAPPRPALPSPVPASTHAVETAVGSLAALSRELPLRVRAAAGWTAQGAGVVWVVVEVGRGVSAGDWTGGGDADVIMLDALGTVRGTARGHVEAGSASVRVRMMPAGLTPGEYEVRVRAKSARAESASNESVGVSVAAMPESTGALFYRAGSSAAAREVPTADMRFRRSERLRVAVSGAAGIATARLLDRTGNPLPVPVSTSRIEDPDGMAWQSAQLTLAPLASGDYVLELTTSAGPDGRTFLAPFRVVPGQ